MKTFAPPPHISMDAYVAFVEETFRAQESGQIRRQKDLEERIEKTFDMGKDPEPRDAPRRTGQ